VLTTQRVEPAIALKQAVGRVRCRQFFGHSLLRAHQSDASLKHRPSCACAASLDSIFCLTGSEYRQGTSSAISSVVCSEQDAWNAGVFAQHHERRGGMWDVKQASVTITPAFPRSAILNKEKLNQHGSRRIQKDRGWCDPTRRQSDQTPCAADQKAGAPADRLPCRSERRAQDQPR